MYEVELKFRVDHDRFRDRLIALGAEPTGQRTQTDTYYDAPHREFAETDEALRIRRESTQSETVEKLTYKGPLVEAESKTRIEHETRVADGAELDRALAGLGFSPAATVEKHREFYALEGYTITLDAVSGLGEFLEIEAAADEESISTVRDGAIDLLAELGLDPDDQIRTSYLGLLLASKDN